MRANEFELHPEEAEKVGKCPGDFLNEVNRRIGHVLGTQIDGGGVIGSIKVDDQSIFASTVKADQVDDVVNSPKHYTHYKGLEVIQLTEQMNFNRGNAVKYIARAGIKDQSKEIEDLEKAKWYIQREIDRIKGDN